MAVSIYIEVDDVKVTCSEETARKILSALQNLFGAPATIVYPPGVRHPDFPEPPYKVTCYAINKG